jgi:tRNA-splicing ligase RtcB
MQIINNIPVWGVPQMNAVEQMTRALSCGAHSAALMADHHLGYSVPVGGVIAYEGAISPSGVGFDIACGNKAVKTDLRGYEILHRVDNIMNRVFAELSFGVGLNSKIDNDHELFYDDIAWNIPFIGDLKDFSRKQLGTIGSGNHYVDIFSDDNDDVWVGVHFGSRGLGHKIATHYIKEGGGTDGINVDPVVLGETSSLGSEYITAMRLAGRYAYAGRDIVCKQVVDILGGKILDEVHNHHNFAWLEEHNGVKLWVVRKGATPAFPGQRGFVGGTMCENSVILEGCEKPELDDAKLALYSTVHGAGRVLSRTAAAGKSKWKNGQKIRVSEGCVSQSMMDLAVENAGIVLRGAGVDESPFCYKRLTDVLKAHYASIRVLNVLTPLGVAMAGGEVHDPYKD